MQPLYEVKEGEEKKVPLKETLNWLLVYLAVMLYGFVEALKALIGTVERSLVVSLLIVILPSGR